MAQVEGFDPDELEQETDAVEAAVAAGLAAIAAAMVAQALPGLPGIPDVPSLPIVDVDSLSVIPTMWLQHVDEVLMPMADNTVRLSAALVEGDLIDAGLDDVPEISDTTVEDILSVARNRLVGIGDDLWENTRAGLVEGVSLGETVPELADRIRGAAAVSEPRARTIARTEVIGASNAASIAQARSAGIEMNKVWLATEDARTREAHEDADGQSVPLNGMFEVGGEMLDFPGDPRGRADNIINCRCAIGYEFTEIVPITASGHDPELCTCMDGGRNHGKPGPCPGWVDALPESHPRRVARRERAAERTFERMTRDAPRGTRRRREPEADPHEGRRDWQRRVDQLRSRAETLAKVEEQLYKDVDDEQALSHVIAAENRKHDYASDPVMASLLTADVSDRAALRATVRQAAQELGMARVGGERLVTVRNRFGDFEVERGHYRRGVMQPLGGERIRDGEPVDVQAPGFTAVVDGQEVTLVPAVVAKAELGAGETEIGETAMSTTFDGPVVAADRTYVRDDDGRFDDVPGVGGAGAADKLKLSGKVPEGVSVRSSRKLKSENQDVLIADVDTPEGPRVRVGVVSEEDSRKWGGGYPDPVKQQRIDEIREELGDLDDAESDDDYDPELYEELSEELDELLDSEEGNRTVQLTPEQVAGFTGQLGESLEKVKANKIIQDRLSEEFDELGDRKAELIAEYGDPEHEAALVAAHHEIERLKQLRRRTIDSREFEDNPEYQAFSQRIDAAQQRLNELEDSRTDGMPEEVQEELNDIELRVMALNAGPVVDDLIMSGGVELEDGSRLAFETWGSDVQDNGWAHTRLGIVAPGKSLRDVVEFGEEASFEGPKGLEKLIKALGSQVTTAAASPAGNLREYWAAKIRWGTDGAFKRCVRQLRKYSEGETEFDTEGLCANMYREATGRWPGSKKDSSILVAAARRYKRDSEGRFAKTAAQVVKEVDDLMARLASLKSSIADDYDEDSGVNLDDALDAMRELRERQAEKAERREALMDSQDYGEINIYLHQDGDVGVTPDEGAEEWFTSAENARELAAGIDDLRKKIPPTPTPGVAGMFETADGSVYARAWNSGDVEIGLTSDRDTPVAEDDDEDGTVPSIVLLRSEEAAEFADLLEEMANRSMGEDEPVTAAFSDYAADELLEDEPCLPCLEPQPGEMWHAVFHTEGMSTGARVWEPGALSWRDPPFAFHWEKEAPAHGGTPRVVQVGNVLRVLREGTRLHAWGNIDLESDDGAEVARKLQKGFLRWISMGPGSEKIVYEQVWPANVDASQMGRTEPEQTIFIDYKIGELTTVSVPAQEGGFIEPVGVLAGDYDQDDPIMVAAAVSLHDPDLCTCKATGKPGRCKGDPWRKGGPPPRARGSSRRRPSDDDVPSSWDLQGIPAKELLRRNPHELEGLVQVQDSRDDAMKALEGLTVDDLIKFSDAIDRGRVTSDMSEEEARRAMAIAIRGRHPRRSSITTASGSSWTIEIPDLPPAWWFEKDPSMPKNAAVTVTDQGRIYGYLAPANSGHRSYARNGERKTLAHLPKTDYSRWLKETIVAGGGRVLAGPLTMECMHAPTQGYGQLDRRHQYYEDSCSIIARVNIGEDPDDGARWIAGAMMPGVTADQFLKFLSSDVSLDQQPHPDIPGVQDFVGILAVPVGGWPKSRTTASVPVTRMEETPDGAVMVASAVPVRHETMGDDLVEQLTIATHDPALCTCMDGGPNHGKRGPCPGWKGKRQTPSVAPEPGTMGKRESPEAKRLAERLANAEKMFGSDRSKWTPAQRRQAESMERRLKAARGGDGGLKERAQERREIDRIVGMKQAQFIQYFEDFLNSDKEVTEADERILRQALEAKGPKVLEALAKELPTTRDNLIGGASHEKLVERIMRGTVGIKMAAQRARRGNTGLEITPEVFASIVGVDLGAVVRNNAAMFATSLGGV